MQRALETAVSSQNFSLVKVEKQILKEYVNEKRTKTEKASERATRLLEMFILWECERLREYPMRIALETAVSHFRL